MLLSFNSQTSFNLPNARAYFKESAPVIGNGMTLGLMTSQSGTKNYCGLMSWFASGIGASAVETSVYDKTIDNTTFSGRIDHASFGVTDKPDTSGIITDLSRNSFDYIIKY